MERIEYLKSNKDRFYDSPFKNQGSHHDFDNRKNETDRGEDIYMQKISLFKNIQNNHEV